MAIAPVVVGAFVAFFVAVYVLMLTDRIDKTVAAIVSSREPDRRDGGEPRATVEPPGGGRDVTG